MDSNEKVMSKIEALLRKAESTNFGPESEALIAKAHELMQRYSIEEAMLHKAEGVRDEVFVMHIPVKAKGKLQQERHILLDRVAGCNRSKAVRSGEFVTVIGYKRDTEFVKVLYESLVLQMFESMLAEGFTTDAANKSFCVGFIDVVDKRMEQVYRTVEEEMAPTGSSTALVLRDRSLAVKDKVQQEFPHIKSSGYSQRKYDPGAAARGRAAGERADIGQSKIGNTKKELR